MKISIVITEPTPGDAGADSIGGFEWRTNPYEAEAEYRSLRSSGCITKIWHGVDMPDDMTPDDITAAVDAVYWDGEPHNWGEPGRTHAPLALLQSAS